MKFLPFILRWGGYAGVTPPPTELAGAAGGTASVFAWLYVGPSIPDTAHAVTSTGSPQVFGTFSATTGGDIFRSLIEPTSGRVRKFRS